MKITVTVLLVAAGFALWSPRANAQPPAPAVPRPAPPDKLDEISRGIDELGQKVDGLKERHWLRDIGPTVVSFLSLLLAIGAVWVTAKHNRRSLKERSREEERKSIHEKLDQFYGPFMHLRGLSKNLYSIFLERRPKEDHEQYAGASGRFATLVALLKGKEFAGVDAVLLWEIIAVGLQSDKLIAEKGGLVDDPALRDMLWKLAAHYRTVLSATF